MNNVIDLLLNLDPNKLKLTTKEVKLSRLSEAVGEDVIFNVTGITMSQFSYVSEAAGENSKDINALIIIEGTKTPNLKDETLLKKYECATPVELINKLLLPGEISGLYNTISELSGFNADAVEEVKN